MVPSSSLPVLETKEDITGYPLEWREVRGKYTLRAIGLRERKGSRWYHWQSYKKSGIWATNAMSEFNIEEEQRKWLQGNAGAYRWLEQRFILEGGKRVAIYAGFQIDTIDYLLSPEKRFSRYEIVENNSHPGVSFAGKAYVDSFLSHSDLIEILGMAVSWYESRVSIDGTDRIVVSHSVTSHVEITRFAKQSSRPLDMFTIVRPYEKIRIQETFYQPWIEIRPLGPAGEHVPVLCSAKYAGPNPLASDMERLLVSCMDELVAIGSPNLEEYIMEVIKTEDKLRKAVESLSKEHRGVLYALLHLQGERVDEAMHIFNEWRKRVG